MPYHALESAENMLVCAAGHIISVNGLVAWEPGMATEKFLWLWKENGEFYCLGKASPIFS